MRPDQLPLLTTVSAPSVHPDGTWAVVATSRPDFDADAYVGQLFRVPLDGSTPYRLTRGRHDGAPQFSPDGTLIGFVREGANERPQVHLMPAQGGEPLCVTNSPLGVGDFAFSPDGRRLAFIARVPDEGRYGTVDDVDDAHEDPRHLTTLAIRRTVWVGCATGAGSCSSSMCRTCSPSPRSNRSDVPPRTTTRS